MPTMAAKVQVARSLRKARQGESRARADEELFLKNPTYILLGLCHIDRK